MKRRTKLVSLFCYVILGVVGLLNVGRVSAVNYQTNVDVGFTFSPSLSVSLSGNDLVISELALGATGVSDEINVTVNTNIAEGYVLSATVGNDSIYDGDSLYNSVDNTKIFDNIATNADLASLNVGNTWGYSYKDNTVTTPAWSNYNGLPLYSATAATLLDMNNASSGSVDFKIAAKVGTNQASGEYNNIVNFVVVSKPIPMTLLDAFVASGAEMYNGYFKMQDMTSDICESVDADGEKGMQLIDVRDDKVYWVAKLKDGNCWMTQNLDLDLSHEVALTSVTSDIDPTTYGTGIYTQANGYSKDNATGVVSWLPSTIVDVDGTPTQRADTMPMEWTSNTATKKLDKWVNDYNHPYSADPGERYRYTNPSSYAENTYASLEACANNNNTVGCQHGHYGNYYNWSAAVANNNTSGYNSGTLVNSVCPKNWDLPVNGAYGTLMQAQSVWDSGSNYVKDGDTNIGFRNLVTAPLYFARFGYVNGGSLNYLGSYGRYWSSTVSNASGAYVLGFNGSNIWPSSINVRRNGFSVRCMVGA